MWATDVDAPDVVEGRGIKKSVVSRAPGQCATLGVSSLRREERDDARVSRPPRSVKLSGCVAEFDFQPEGLAKPDAQASAVRDKPVLLDQPETANPHLGVV